LCGGCRSSIGSTICDRGTAERLSRAGAAAETVGVGAACVGTTGVEAAVLEVFVPADAAKDEPLTDAGSRAPQDNRRPIVRQGSSSKKSAKRRQGRG
jgi:hypothetical protein